MFGFGKKKKRYSAKASLRSILQDNIKRSMFENKEESYEDPLELIPLLPRFKSNYSITQAKLLELPEWLRRSWQKIDFEKYDELIKELEEPTAVEGGEPPRPDNPLSNTLRDAEENDPDLQENQIERKYRTPEYDVEDN